MAFKVAAFAILLAVVVINAAPQMEGLPGGMTTPDVGEMPVGGNQTNPGDLPTTVPSNPAEGIGGAENATVPANIGGVPNRLTNRINRLNNRN